MRRAFYDTCLDPRDYRPPRRYGTTDMTGGKVSRGSKGGIQAERTACGEDAKGGRHALGE